jgi:hypothetical protein
VRGSKQADERVSAHKLISALVCDAEKNFIAAGIENPEDGPNSSPVYIWYKLSFYILTIHGPIN